MLTQRRTKSDKKAPLKYPGPWSYRPLNAIRVRVEAVIEKLSEGDVQIARGLRSEMLGKGIKAILPEYETRASLFLPKAGSKNPTSAKKSTP